MERPPVDVAMLRSALDGAWARVDVVDETESTNAVLLADTTAPDRSVLVAEHQVHGRGGLDLTLKWPNDLLDGPSQGKLAGILAQTNGEAVVVGIGLNVSTARDELPV